MAAFRLVPKFLPEVLPSGEDAFQQGVKTPAVVVMDGMAEFVEHNIVDAGR